MGGGLGSRNIHRQKTGRGRGQRHSTETLGSLIASQTSGTTESRRDTENPEPSPPTQSVTQMPRQGQGEPGWPLTASFCLCSGVVSFHVASAATPTAIRLRPSSAWACGGSSRLGRVGSYSTAPGAAQASPPMPPWDRTPSSSPALANSLSLHLDCEELPGATLEYRGVTSVLRKPRPPKSFGAAP